MANEVIGQLVDPALLDACHAALQSCGWTDEILRPYLYAETDTILRIKNLSKRFGTTSVLGSVNLDVKRGEILGITGKTGGGKSTLCNVIAGITRPDSGSIEISETNSFVPLSSNSVPSLIGYSMQRPSFYPDLSVRSNLKHYLSIFGRVSEMSNTAQHFDLIPFADVIAGDLSAGAQRRLDIALAIANHPRVLLLDEPFAELDDPETETIWAMLTKLHNTGTTIIITTKHNAALQDRCDRIITL